MPRAAVLAARFAVLFAALFTFTGAAQACGYCVEDKMAAVYDHAVVTRALREFCCAGCAATGPERLSLGSRLPRHC